MPYLRRYARAVTGGAAHGDLAVEQMLEALHADLPGHITRIALFRALDSALAGRPGGTPPDRRALLLTAMEGFADPEAASVLGVQQADFAGLLAQAESNLAQARSSRVCIIEDEPLIGASLSQIVTSLGHTVTGVVSTRADAVSHALAEKPDLVLADIELADGSQGTDAVAEIRRAHAVPAIFITAFPERLLGGRPGEPTFLIPKPFRSSHVRAVITQALFLRSTGKT